MSRNAAAEFRKGEYGGGVVEAAANMTAPLATTSVQGHMHDIPFRTEKHQRGLSMV